MSTLSFMLSLILGASSSMLGGIWMVASITAILNHNSHDAFSYGACAGLAFLVTMVFAAIIAKLIYNLFANK